MSFNRIIPLAMALVAVLAAPTPNAPLKRQCNTTPPVPPAPVPVSTASNNTPVVSHIRPWFSTYVDVQTGLDSAEGWPTPDDLGDWNDFLIAFWMTSGPSDASSQWAALDASDQQRIADSYREKGKTIRLAIFGGTQGSIASSSSNDPKDIATKVAEFTTANHLHGVDVDYEDSQSFRDPAGTGEDFLIQLTRTLRELLPAEDGYIISHAPQAPYFTTAASAYPRGAYRKVHEQVGDLIDFYNIQYYNQGDEAYDTCESLLTDADGPSAQPGTSIAGIIKGSGVPREKLVLGKPAHAEDLEGSGFMKPDAIGACILNAPTAVKPGGVMAWQWKKNTTEDMKTWIGLARGDLELPVSID